MTDPSTTILRGAGFPAAGVVLLTAAGFGLAGWAEAASALLGGGLVLAALVINPLVQRLTRRLDPAVVLGIVVMTYSVVVIGLGIVFSQVNDLSWVHGTPAGIGGAGAVMVWCAGHIWATTHMRQLLYDIE